MKYSKLDSKPDLQKIQQEILDFWADKKIFEKSLENKKSVSVFVDGPPFPTGIPHQGTMFMSFIKDMTARYKTMRGFSVPRVWGWDCHGLPIETQVEKVLGITEKKQIESEIGVAKFNESCFNLVSANNDTWKKYVREMCRWVDYENSYKTMDVDFMESVLWTFKQCYDKGLIYKDYRVTPYCPRCETSLSISDTKESDSTRPRQDPWVMVKFKTEQVAGGKPVSLLAWTTTPWTLPSNMALAVAENIDYVFVDFKDEVCVLGRTALQRYEKIFGKEPRIIKTCKGRDLVGLKYTPVFAYFNEKAKDGAFRVVAGNFITEDEGVGIVHIAPAFGEDDYWTCKVNGIPLVNPVDVKGHFIDDVKDFTGRQVIEANQDIIRFLKQGGFVVDSGTLEHNYPHCWRCRGPLIHKAMDAWYFSVDKIKDKLIKANQLINWVPESVKVNRFGAWLEGARDWNISRNRYWSTPIPVWECENCHERTVLGSIEEIYKASGVRLENLHKQFMDKVTIKCKCGGVKKRVPEVLDCWFEAGSVPHAQKHYPFENKRYFESNSPCDFIVESAGQIRCWFYYLHVLSVALFGKPAFRNAIVPGTILAKDGKKISKSLKNYTDPMELMQKFGTDAFRLYMFRSNAMLGGDMLFDDAGLLDALQQIILPFWSACNFFTGYAVIDGFGYENGVVPDSGNPLDQWMLARIYEVGKSLTEKTDSYRIDKYVDEIVPLVDDLTNWYIRRSRRRFWGNEFTDDKKDAYETLSYVLVTMCKFLAPVAPVVAEKLFKHLTGGESVHLESWPEIPKKFENGKLIEKLGLVQNVINLARSIRAKNGVKNRQPLGKINVALSDMKSIAVVEESKQIICEELNVKELEIIKDVSLIAEVQYLPNFAVLNKKYGKQIAEITKAIRGGEFQVNNDVLTLTLGGVKTVLDKEDVLIKHTAKQGLYVAGGDGVVVALDLTITEELVREGVAREIVRNIQDARKQMSCDISDEILIRFGGQKVPQEWLGYIYGETLGRAGDFKSADVKCEIETDSGIIIAEIKRNA